MNLSKTRAIVLVDRLHHVLETWYPILRLREAGCLVTVAGPDAGVSYASNCDFPIESEIAARDIDLADFDCLVIPGGYSADFLRRDPEIVKFAGAALRAGKIVSVICHGGWLLASAGALEGRTLTSVGAIKVDLENAGAKWIDEAIVRDGNLITSRAPDDLPQFMKCTLDALNTAVCLVA